MAVGSEWHTPGPGGGGRPVTPVRPLLVRLTALVHAWTAPVVVAAMVAAAAVVGALLGLLVAVLSPGLAAGPAAVAGAAAGIVCGAVPASLLVSLLDDVARLRAELLEDLKERRTTEYRLRRLADTDDLTGLLNRRAFFARARAIVALARRYGHPVAVALVDIDRFKSINDRFGHAAGDEALREVAEALRREARASDVVARMGGDEFVVLMPMTALGGARVFAERLRRRLAMETTRPLSVSIGLASAQGERIDVEALLVEADRMLLAAKRAGRDRVYPPPEGDDGSG